MTVVVDASALVIAAADTSGRGDKVRQRVRGGAIAPHLVDAELGQAFRGLARRNALESAAADRSFAAAELLVTERYPHAPLRTRAWELRNNVSFYDALYVALAEATGLALVTADLRLASATGPRCQRIAV